MDITTSTGAETIKNGDAVIINGKPYKVVSIESCTSFTIRPVAWYDRLWLWVKRLFGAR